MRLHNDLNLNLEIMDVVFNLLTKVANLETTLKAIKSRLGIYEPKCVKSVHPLGRERFEEHGKDANQNLYTLFGFVLINKLNLKMIHTYVCAPTSHPDGSMRLRPFYNL